MEQELTEPVRSITFLDSRNSEQVLFHETFHPAIPIIDQTDILSLAFIGSRTICGGQAIVHDRGVVFEQVDLRDIWSSIQALWGTYEASARILLGFRTGLSRRTRRISDPKLERKGLRR